MMKYPDLTAGDGEYLLNLIGGWEKFQQLKVGALTLVVRVLDLLSRVTTTELPAVALFSAEDTFGAKKPAIRLWFLGDTFKKVFLGKVERTISAATLVAYTLTKPSLDAPIRAELGDRANTTLAHLWELLTKQPNGEDGTLLTNGRANIFYILDDNGTPWAVDAYWNAGCGWGVDADSVGSPREWGAGGRVVSRK